VVDCWQRHTDGVVLGKMRVHVKSQRCMVVHEQPWESTLFNCRGHWSN